MSRQKLLPVISLTLVLVLLVWTLVFWKPESATTTPALPVGGDFTLQSASGSLSLHDLRGKVALLYFGYTSCPDICPSSLTFIHIALSQLSEEELAKVQGVFISVDPQRDTPERLAQYSKHFNSHIEGVTGTPEQIAELAKRYGVIYQIAEGDSAMGYTVDHSSVTYIIDQQGKLVSALPHGSSPKRILQEVRHLLGN